MAGGRVSIWPLLRKSQFILQHYKNEQFPFLNRVSFRKRSYQKRDVDLSAIRKTLHCDTHALVQQLQLRGFTTEQAEAITEALVEMVNVTLEQQSRDMVTKSQQEILTQQLLAEIAAVKKDMIILEKSEFSNLRNITEKQSRDILQIRDTMKDEMSKLEGKILLDINLERGRTKEEFADKETHISNINNKIDTKIADLRTTFEQHRNDVLRYAGGTIFSCLTITLGFYRLWS
ncbi:coiled-coil domain-containing protein 90B, mitochondrial-like [Argonauta hians]